MVSVPEDGMDRALEKANYLYRSADAACRNNKVSSNEQDALIAIRDCIGLLESQVRAARLATNQSSKEELVNGVDPFRRDVIRICQEKQQTVPSYKGLIMEILDWCELKHGDSRTPAPTTPVYYRGSIDDVQRSTEGIISQSALSTTTDVSSAWMQSQARTSQGKAAALGAAGATSASLSDWQAKQSLRTVKMGSSSAGASGTGLTINTSYKGSPARHVRGDQSLASGAAAAEGPAAGMSMLGMQRSSEGVAGSAQAQEQQPSWRVQSERAQQIARQLRAQPFLHLDRPLGSYSSGGSGEQDLSGVLGVTRYRNQDDESETPAAASGWDSVQHLRQPQPPKSNSSLRTSHDISRALRNGNVMQAAILSSNASRVHILHDAVAMKPGAEDGLVDVPVVPSCLAVGRKRRWWVSMIKVLAGTAGVAVALAAVAISTGGVLDDFGKRCKGSCETEEVQLDQHKERQQQSHGAPKQQHAPKGKGQQQQVVMPRLPYAPIGPAPDASAGCG